MTKPTIPQSQKRFSESIGHLFATQNDNKVIFLKSSSDVGVILNNGRNGARFAPQSFLSTFKKMTQDEITKRLSFLDIEVSSPLEEEKNFDEAQLAESHRIKQVLDQTPSARLIHLGGGHDHIYPLLNAYSHSYKKIIVLNIDAHADTRTDASHHSGTPFRQFANEFKGKFFLYQIGLHPFANSFSTLGPLEKGTQAILWKDDLDNSEKVKEFFQSIKSQVDSSTLVIFSLDADAMKGELVPGVSAVNHDGLSLETLKALWSYYLDLSSHHKSILGLYELNPLYDTLSAISMRTLSSFVFYTLKN